MDASVWKGRRVFVSGHTGFKGSWLCLWLQRLGAEVVGYSLPAPTNPSLYEAANVGAGMVSIMGDVRDYARLRDSLEQHRPEVVFHLAAQSVVRLSYDDPIETYSTNVMGTVNLLEALRHAHGGLAIVNVTSDKSYHNNEWPWGYRESDRLGGRDPYSNSKACSELVSQAFRDSYFATATGGHARKSLATARAGNVVGGGDWTRDQLLPDVINALRDRRPAVLRNPLAVRPWQFVLDCLDGYLTLAERLVVAGSDYEGAWNFGPRLEDTLTVQQLVEQIIAKWPEPATWAQDDASHPHEAATLKLDSSKAAAQLGWKPRLPIADALDWIVEWYWRYFQGDSAKVICLDQIERFERSVAARAC